MARKQLIENFDNDSVWKELLEKYLKEFMEFFFPEAYEKIDWEKGYEFLDKELQKVIRTAIGKRRYVDKLVKVWLKDGTEVWVLLHIEIQSQWEEDFSERMYIYQYRIFDRYKKKVASFVIFTDENPNWKPNKFEYSLLGCKQSWQFNIVKLLDYKNFWKELETNKNIFSVVVMAHLKLQETKNNVEERYKWKKNLIKLLYEKGYSKEDILELFHFLDWLIVLPENLEQKLDQELEEFEGVISMPYITGIERRATQRGFEQGHQEGRQEGRQEGHQEGHQEGKRLMVIRLLRKKLGLLEAMLEEKLEKLTVDELDALGEAMLDFQDGNDLAHWLKRHP